MAKRTRGAELPTPSLPHDLVLERFVRLFRLQVGQGREWSVAQLASTAGVPIGSVKAHQEGRHLPSLAVTLAYAAVLRPGFANGLLALAGLAGAQPLRAEAPSGPEAMTLLALRLHKLAVALQDEVLCHRDAGDLAPEFRQLSAEMAAFAEALELKREGA